MNKTIIDVAEIERVACDALVLHGASAANAALVARAIALAEAEGNPVCGLYYLRIFCDHLSCGKVDGNAAAILDVNGSVVKVDAAFGFAHPAIAMGLPALIDLARSSGIAALGVRNSYNCLALRHHVRPLADSGLIGICMSNAPASVSPPGALRRLFGTNPLAFAIPTASGPPIVVDQSMSVVTKTAMIMRREKGQSIPEGWAQDRTGNPTTNPASGLEGSLLPAGGQKGANIALLVEILAAALTGSNLSTQASSLGGNEGGPPALGQLIIAIDPDHFAGKLFTVAIDALALDFGAADVRLPGRQRKLETAVDVDSDLWHEARRLSGNA